MFAVMICFSVACTSGKRASDKSSKQKYDSLIGDIKFPFTKEDEFPSVDDDFTLAKKYSDVNIGEYITFGNYEQDNDVKNGKEDIEWLVLDKDDDKIFVISKYALDCMQYDSADANWETCSLRKWLNNDFLSLAFSAQEKKIIPTITVSPDKNSKYNTNPGKATKDRVFLLSVAEAGEYFSSQAERKCTATSYAIANGVETVDGSCWWWLRSPGEEQAWSAFVNYVGFVASHGYTVYDRSIAVRPAMWIKLN